jgi:hypothetical protein
MCAKEFVYQEGIFQKAGELVRRRCNMDRSTDCPWSWEEEIEWKADLEERDYDFLEQLIDNAIEEGTSDSINVAIHPGETPTGIASGPRMRR